MNKTKLLDKTLSLSLCLILALTLLPVPSAAEPEPPPPWAGMVAAGFHGGSGTAANPYQIATGTQLAYLAQEVNKGNQNGGSDYAGKYFELTDDLNLSGGLWTPIGKLDGLNTYAFKGSFDGGGHSVTYLAVGTSGISVTTMDNGLFGHVGEGGALKNLTVSGAVYGMSGSNCGILVGQNDGSITNCSAAGDVSGGIFNGILVGQNDGSITNCSAAGSASGGTNNGGLVGWNKSSIINCYATGSVPGGTANNGGLVGHQDGGSFTSCYYNNTAGKGVGSETENPGGVTGKSLGEMQTQAFAVTLNGYAPDENAPLFHVWAWENGRNDSLPYLTENYRATVTHGSETTGFNSFKAASVYVGTLSDASIANTTLTLGMDMEIDGGEYNVRPGDMPAKPCTIDGGGHELTATTTNIYLNADTAMKDIVVGTNSTYLKAHSYQNTAYTLTLEAGFSTVGNITGFPPASRLQVKADISCGEMSNFSEVSLSDGVTVTIAAERSVYGIGTLDPGTGSAFAFSGSNIAHANFQYPRNGITEGKSIILKANYAPTSGEKLIEIYKSNQASFNPAAIVLGEGYSDFALLKNVAGTGDVDYYVLAEPVDKVEFSVSPNSIIYGGGGTTLAVTLQPAESKPPLASRAGDTVTFYDGETKLGRASIDPDGVTTPYFGWTKPTAGTHTLKAVYQDIGRAPVTGTASLTVNPKPLTITAATVEDKVFNGKTGASVTDVTFGNLESGDSLTLGTDYYMSVCDFEDASAGENKKVTVRVGLKDTAAARNYAAPSTAPSVPTTAKITPKPIGGTVDILPPPGGATISPGTTLSCSTSGITGRVDSSTVQLSYQWYWGSEAIGGATLSSWTLDHTPSGFLSVRVTATGNYSGTLESVPVAVDKIPLGGSVSIEKPTWGSDLYSHDIVGKSLTLVTSALLPAAAEYDIRWLRNGAAISGANDVSYTLVQEDVGKTLSAQAVGRGNYTGSVSASVEIPYTYPDAPVITLTPGDGQVTVNWTAPFDGGSPISDYELYVFLEADETKGQIADSPFKFGPDVRSHTVTGLTNGKSYWFKVWVDTAKSSASNSQQAAPQAPAPGGGGGGGGTSAQTSGGDTPVSYTVSGGTASLTLPESKVAELIEKSKGGAAVLDLSAAKGVTAAELPKAALASIANAGLDLTLKLPAATVTLDEAAAASVAAQAAGEKVSVSIAPVAASSLTAVQQEAVNSGDLVLDISIRSGGKPISSFDGGTLTVRAPYTGPLPPAVWYLNDAGELEKLNCAYENGVVTFVLDHLSLYVVGRDPNPFADVPETAWFAPSVKYVYEKDLMNGTSAAAFNPQGSATRGMLVAILHRLEGGPAAAQPAAGGASFSDVAAGKYYAEAVAWAAENGLVSGYADGSFRPDAAVTRQQLAAILMKYAALKGGNVSGRADLSGFADAASVAGYAGEAMAWANAEGLIQGGGGRLNPAGKATRAQLAAILQRFIGNDIK